MHKTSFTDTQRNFDVYPSLSMMSILAREMITDKSIGILTPRLDRSCQKCKVAKCKASSTLKDMDVNNLRSFI